MQETYEIEGNFFLLAVTELQKISSYLKEDLVNSDRKERKVSLSND